LTVPRWGNGTLRELSKLLGDGAHAESERLLHRLLRQHGIGGWQANLRIEVRGSVCYIDVAFPSRRLAIEIDGMAWHSTPDRFQRDRTRQNALVASGWRVLRFTWWDLVERPGYVVGLISSELAAAS
jgi:very-short-patch-repair endonuclease